MIRLRWWILLSLWMTISAFDCPEGMGCGPCWSHPDGHYEMDCTTSNDDVFKFEIKPGSHIVLQCPFGRVTDWTDLDFTTLRPIENIKSLSVKFCDLPDVNMLGKIARQLLRDNVERFEFKSYKNLSLQLTTNHFRDFHNITELTLSYNNLSDLPNDLLRNFPNLTMLNLLKNNLPSLPKNFFTVKKLRVLEIGLNNIETIAPGTFDNLEHLTLLNMWENNISELSSEIFDKLASLQSLDLRRNRLKKLPSDIFANLTHLRVISLSQNFFTKDSLPGDLFRNNTELETVSMFENKHNMTTLPDGFFANLTNLMIVKLRKNGFTTLPENLFWGTTKLQTVGLERNYLTTLPEMIFRDSTDLVSIDLNFNDLRYLPDKVFAKLGKLVKLNLPRNHLTNISENLFSGLSSLQELNMAMNNLKTIHNNAFTFLQNLRIATFAQNSLQLDSCRRSRPSPFQPCKAIQELDLSRNNITFLCDDWKYALLGLRILNLSHNRVGYLEGTDFQFFSASSENRVTVDLSHNNITGIYNMQTLETWATENSRPEWLTFTIANNPLRCDCRVYSLLRFLEGRMSAKAKNAFVLKVKGLKCASPEKYRDQDVADLRSDRLTCDVDVTLDHKLPKPLGCSYHRRPDDEYLLINCANGNLTEFPDRLEVQNDDRRVELNLSENLLTKMGNFRAPGYDKVRRLLLDHNKISVLSFDEFPQQLETLQLHNNNLTTIDSTTLNNFKNATNLRILTLHSNPWTCDCETRDLLNLVQTRTEIITELSKITCHETKLAIFTMTPEELCPTEYMWIIVSCIVVAIFGITIGTTAALYYRHQREIKVWLYSRQWCLWFVTEDELDRDKIYDAFVSYSHKDEEFVVKNLLPKLEEGPRPFKLCVHFRDWLAGEWIPKQIARSVEESRRTIVVLSPNFLESVWGRMEFRAAHSQALSEGRARLIVVLYGDIGPTDNLDPELKAYLTMNTYVKWGDPWFWEKLKYALPHPQKFNERRGNNVFQTTQPCGIGVIDDKNVLINDVDQTITKTTTIDDVKIVVPDGKTNFGKINESVKLSIKDLNSRNNAGLSTIVANNEKKHLNGVRFETPRCTTV